MTLLLALASCVITIAVVATVALLSLFGTLVDKTVWIDHLRDGDRVSRRPRRVCRQ